MFSKHICETVSSPWWMCNNAKSLRRSLVIDDRSHVFNRRNAENERSQETDPTGSANNNENTTRILVNKLVLRSLENLSTLSVLLQDFHKKTQRSSSCSKLAWSGNSELKSERIFSMIFGF